MRAVAVLSVVVVHVSLFGGALEGALVSRALAHLNIGVTVFFLISGFLLYRPFIAHRAAGPPAPQVLDYVKRRLLRILPAYWLVLTVLVILPGQTGVVDGEWIRQFGLFHTVPLPSDDSSCVSAILDCGLAQTWSLAVEMTFYVLLPLYVVAAARLARRGSVAAWMRAELLLLGGLAVASVVGYFFVLGAGTQSWVGGTAFAYLLWFGLGMAFAVLSVGLGYRPLPLPLRLLARRPGVPWLVAIFLYLALSLWLPITPFLAERGDLFVAHLTFGLIAALLMLPAVFGDDLGGLPRRLLAHPWVAWVGLISYGIFLWHYAIALQLGAGGSELGFGPLLLATLGLTIPIAAASYYLVERPILRLKYRSLRDLLGTGGGPSPSPPRADQPRLGHDPS